MREFFWPSSTASSNQNRPGPFSSTSSAFAGGTFLVCSFRFVSESPRIAETDEGALQHAQHKPEPLGLQQQFLQAPGNLFTLMSFRASASRWAKRTEALGQTGQGVRNLTNIDCGSGRNEVSEARLLRRAWFRMV